MEDIINWKKNDTGPRVLWVFGTTSVVAIQSNEEETSDATASAISGTSTDSEGPSHESSPTT